MLSKELADWEELSNRIKALAEDTDRETPRTLREEAKTLKEMAETLDSRVTALESRSSAGPLPAVLRHDLAGVARSAGIRISLAKRPT